ncbi:WecB/TagA/CpsF family glycosyltransferase [Aurantiacibacter marinus]|uniref:UDP-phosphate galactose phosphotransferase n=1 Tax=Aurantiacibacter marinus TaxID=874156 RepID=A0A0H0XT56_9SPHN|nr:WecB/TagA/CpsF family glycosyltransferase [Aurantiacibacter marinus]KLI65132.1 UDP-phosphate galactose phosphotransferase [Aurantiacibacter marinus]
MYQSFDTSTAHAAAQHNSWATRSLPSRFASKPKTTSLFGLDLLDGDKVATARMLVEKAIRRERATVGFINAHCVNVAAKDAAYRDALQNCDHLLPDGSGVRIAARLAGKSYRDNLNGTDLFPLICDEAAQRGATLFLLGGEDGVAIGAALEMMRRYPGLRIVGAEHGYFRREDTAGLISRINGSGADMLLVGFGVPMQERWLADHAGSIAASVQMGVGGLFDYYSNRIPRAPQAVREMGCEWVWRLAQEPRRLAERYLIGNAAFLARACIHAVEVRTGVAPTAAIKRAGDFMATFIGLMLLAPIFAVIALAIKLEDRGPVFFSQTRIGEGGKPFRVWKFRSMIIDAERVRAQLEAHSDRDSVCFKMRRDPRITRVGALLRRTSMDELPQLFNVLTGDMSLVGPRPALPQEVNAYWDRALHRLHAKPGITCTWQVSGRAEIPFAEQVEMDIDYVERHNPLHDIVLLLRTVPAVITGRGAY